MSRRTILLSTVGVLLMANGAYFLWQSRHPDPASLEWVGYMPELEASQRQNPSHFIQSADGSDKRYTVWDYNGDLPAHLLARAALVCKTKAWTLATYVPRATRPTFEQPIQMPDRLYFDELSQAQQHCVRHNLPRGYALAHLMNPVAANRIGWGSHDLQLTPPRAARTMQAD